MKRAERGLDARLAALARAVELADGRLDAAAVASAQAVVTRAGARMGLGMEATVVALAGPTGAGKSTLFNALAGAELSSPGVRRPTTSTVSAAVWGEPPEALLDWLEVGTRHLRDGTGQPAGLVLLDLPDYDSVETRHRDEVDRVVELVDLLVWVVDPQKYADAALHDRYLKRLTAYEQAMVLVLNQSDRLSDGALAACRSDVERLLDQDGLPGVPVLPVSATTGLGLDALQRLLRERVEGRKAAAARLDADVTAAAVALDAGCSAAASGADDESGGRSRRAAPGVTKADRARLSAALGEAAGVPLVVSAVARAHRQRGAQAAGWRPARWIGRLRRDPLKRLRLADRSADANEDVRTSIPPASPVQRAQADSAARGLAAAATDGLPAPWPALARRAATAREEELPDRLDRAIAGADLGVRRPKWWALAGLLQRALSLAALAGALWLAVLMVLGYLQLDDVIPTPDLEGFALPTLLLVGGLLLGLILAGVARWANGFGAARRARVAERGLRVRIDVVAEELVVSPVEAELEARLELCGALAELGAASRRR